MSKPLVAATLVAFTLVACDGAVERQVEKRAAEEIAKVAGTDATVDLTETGGTVTVGDDRIDITTGADPRREPPKDVPLPNGAQVVSVIPGIAQDVVRLTANGTLRMIVDSYDLQAKERGYTPVGEPTVAEGGLWSRWRADGKPGLSLLGHETKGGGIALTLVIERRPAKVTATSDR